MTLEEQIRPHTQYWDCYNDEPELYNHTGKVLKIADNYAIDFADWLIKRETKYFESLKALLQLYKKEKGL